MKFTKIEAGKYRAENGYTIKAYVSMNIFTGRNMKADWWNIYNTEGTKIDGAPSLKQAKAIVEKEYN